MKKSKKNDQTRQLHSSMVFLIQMFFGQVENWGQILTHSKLGSPFSNRQIPLFQLLKVFFKRCFVFLLFPEIGEIEKRCRLLSMEPVTRAVWNTSEQTMRSQCSDVQMFEHCSRPQSDKIRLFFTNAIDCLAPLWPISSGVVQKLEIVALGIQILLENRLSGKPKQ